MDALDRLFLDRAYELARRGIGNTSPNPCVGAVLVVDDCVVGEGYHHRAGEPHAEVLALREAADRAKGATLYVSLEPCNHHGRTPPCSQAVVAAGVARVVIGIADPNPKTDGGGLRALREAGVAVEIADDAQAREIIEPFARAITQQRPYVTLKIAASFDGFIASRSGAQEWLTGARAREFVRELRIAHDAVAVGAGTIRVDNPQLSVRPLHHRLREYQRVVLCESDSVDPASRVFAALEGYAKTLVVGPAGARARFAAVEPIADVVLIGEAKAKHLDIAAALRVLCDRGITSLLCEGGPTIAARLLDERLVDRVCWLLAPRALRAPQAVAALTHGSIAQVPGLHFDRVERLEPDMLLSGLIISDV